ncbi:MAG: sortase, partial [Bacilli bacterium]
RDRKRAEYSNALIDKIDNVIKDNDKVINPSAEAEVKYKGNNFTVLGKIKIKKINFYQPILKENTKLAFNTSVVKMMGPDLNNPGNVSIAGHNYMKNVFFMKINKLVVGDIIIITDLSGKSLKYSVYEHNVASADDPSYLADNNNYVTEITLVTCTKGGKERYYVKARLK